MRQYADREAGIYLRPMTPGDTELIIGWRNRDSVRENFIYQAPFTREGHENWIRTMIETGKAVQMIICESDGDLPVGSVYIRDIDREHNKAEYGIFIGEESARGRGIGTAAARLMLRYCFEEEKLQENFNTLMEAIVKARPSALKGQFLRSITVSSTMGSGVKVSVAKF